MAYQAIIARLKNVRAHPNADRVKLATTMGSQIVVGLDNEEDQLGVFFSDDGCLSHSMASNNNLYSKSKLNFDTSKTGYFGKNARIRAQGFRGEKSYGFWTELSSLAWTGVDLNSLEEGFTFTHLNGQEVCKKYINPATLRHSQKNRINNKNELTKSLRKRFSQLKEHFDTKQLRYEISKIPEGSILYLTEKCHGTSGRTGHIYAELPLSSTKKWWNSLFLWIKKFEPDKTWKVVTGTRRVVLNPDQTEDKGYYSGHTFRIDIHKKLKDLCLPKGLTLFYEICGFTDGNPGSSIMPQQSIEKIGDKKLRKLLKRKYGDKMAFSYSCAAENENPDERYKVFVYRATITNQDGKVFELPWPQVKGICNTLGLTHVPELRAPHFYKDASRDGQDALLAMVEGFLDVDSIIDPSHITEGVCVRIETPIGETFILKDKGYIFKVLEGIIKSDETVIDTEEAEDIAANGEE